MALPEVWLRGPLPDVPALLQPVAHSLVQCREEVARLLPTLTADQLAMRPGGAASIEFHVRHAAGSLDRLFTYARGDALSSTQKDALLRESSPSGLGGEALVADFSGAIDRALSQLRATKEDSLLDARGVGRARLPSTVIGLLFHGAEHTQRHAGQMAAIARVISAPHA